MRNLFYVILILILSSSNCLAQASSADQITPLVKGSQVPLVELTTLEGSKIKLSEILGNEPAVVIFYRGGWCPYCNLHLGELQKIEAELKKLGVKIIAVSPDSSKNLKDGVKDKKLSYQLYSDNSMDASKAFGIAFRVDDQTYKALIGFGVNIEEASGHSHRLLPVPAAFLVDKDGVIRFHYANADYKVRVSSDKLIEEAKALQK